MKWQEYTNDTEPGLYMTDPGKYANRIPEMVRIGKDEEGLSTSKFKDFDLYFSHGDMIYGPIGDDTELGPKNQITSPKEIQELISLSGDQIKSLGKLRESLHTCRRAGIFFFQISDRLCALNGFNVAKMVEVDGLQDVHPRSIDHFDFQSVRIVEPLSEACRVVVFK